MSVELPDDPKRPAAALLYAPVAMGMREAALVLGLSPRTLETMAAAGSVPSFRVGRRRLFPRLALEAWAEAQAEAAATLTTEGGAA